MSALNHVSSSSLEVERMKPGTHVHKQKPRRRPIQNPILKQREFLLRAILVLFDAVIPMFHCHCRAQPVTCQLCASTGIAEDPKLDLLPSEVRLTGKDTHAHPPSPPTPYQKIHEHPPPAPQPPSISPYAYAPP